MKLKENLNFIKGSQKTDNYKYYKHVPALYIISHDTTNHFYIGQTSAVGRRLSHHFGCLARGVSNSWRLQELYDKTKYEDFSFEVIEIEDDEERARVEQTLLDLHYDNPLLLNTTSLNQTWIDERNKEMAEKWKAKISDAAKLRVGDKNPFYGKVHSEDTRRKISKSNLGRENPSAHKSIVINGVLHKSMTHAAKDFNLSVGTIKNRVDSSNQLYCNWYVWTEEVGVKVINEGLLFDPSSKPDGLYEIEGNTYFKVKKILEDYNLKSSTFYNRIQSPNFPEWKKLV